MCAVSESQMGCCAAKGCEGACKSGGPVQVDMQRVRREPLPHIREVRKVRNLQAA